MSIQSEISRIAGNIASAYSALSAKGATMPSVRNTANLASAIESIQGGEAMSIETIREICGWTPYNDIFANNDWATIIEACQQNKVPDTWVAGNSKTMTINGTDYQIDIIGKNHDTYASGGTAPLTFQLHDCYGAGRMNSSATTSGGWTSCEMRNTTLPAILALMPSEVQSGIKAVNKLTSSDHLGSSVNTTADKLFLLAEREVFGSRYYSPNVVEGSQYAYYANGGSKVKYYNSTAQLWWERSPLTSSGYFCAVSTTGGFEGYQAHTNRYVSFAFCF